MKPRTLRITCPACPWQAEGELEDGRIFYMRHRFCRLSLGIGATLDEAVRDPHQVVIAYHEDNGDCGEEPGRGFCSGLEGEEIAFCWQLLTSAYLAAV